MQQMPKGSAKAVDRGNPEIQECRDTLQFLPEKSRRPAKSDCHRRVDVLVEDIPLSRNKAHILNAATDRLHRQMMHRTSLRNHIFLNHQAAHVVGAKQKCQLTNLLPLSHPGRLNVREIVQIQTTDRLRLQILKRTRRGNVGDVLFLIYIYEERRLR